MNKGTCLLSYLPMRSEPRSGAEMVNCLLFGESYQVLEAADAWLKIKCDYDGYEGWISQSAQSEFVSFPQMVDALFVEAVSNGSKFYIPCGAMMPSDNKLNLDGQTFTVTQKLKTNHHLPLSIRLLNTAKAFLNTPYLWGGRSFMGIDCSGLMQIVFKVNGILLPRDTSKQILEGSAINFGEQQACDLVFFSKPGADKVVHVGMMLNEKHIIHAGARVRINELSSEGIFMDGALAYQLMTIKRII